ncbi:uncharacterized protein LOC118199908 [Stegodyphus dumicola]|uniref:uncharacterized protein LOC118199908 n=1 Tax=Stegodyphus dumicola TaxID=202533 RepID=UPI0015ADD890|nr:uncharacterized protein LOC118199908 [Stegodyphus dumicola]
MVSDMLSQIESLQLEYYDVIDDENLSSVDLEFEEMEDRLEEIKVSLQTLLLNSDLVDKSLTNDIKNPNSISIKLPDLSLPEFDGCIENWSDFKNQFDSLITNNSSLNDIKKLFYLRSALKRDAKAVEIQDSFQSLFEVLAKIP